MNGKSAPLDLVRLRYFATVADLLHFGRAAEALHVSQPVLSRQVQKLEQELGVTLLRRTSRKVELTPAGVEVLAETRHLLSAEEATRRRLERIAGGLSTLSIGFWPTDSLGPCLRQFSAKRPEMTIQLTRVYWRDQTEVLRDGRVDVAFLHGPVEEDGLEIVDVRDEPRLVALPSGHRLAREAEVGMRQLEDEPVLVYAGADPEWEAFGQLGTGGAHRRPILGPVAHNVEEGLQYIAAGQAIGFPPRSAVLASVADVAYVPVSDIPPLRIRLAWDAQKRSSLIQDFAEAVLATS